MSKTSLLIDVDQQYGEDVSRGVTEDQKLKTELAALENDIAEAVEKRDRVKCSISKNQQQLLEVAQDYATRSQTPTASTMEGTPIFRSATVQLTAEESEGESLSLGEDEDSFVHAMPRYRRNVQAKDGDPTHFARIHADFPTVIYVDRAWTEIWCGRCGSNYNVKQKLFRGIQGLHSHWQAHAVQPEHASQMEDVSRAACLRESMRRIVSSRDVELMRAGNSPQDIKYGYRDANKNHERMTPGANGAGSRQHTAGPALETPKIVAGTTSATNNFFRANTISRADLTSTAKPVASKPVKRSKRSAATSLHAAVQKQCLTEYEAYQNIETHARAEGTPKSKKMRLGHKNQHLDEDEAPSSEPDEVWGISSA
ncbi:hypothetical protein LTR01_004666 [Friedmanniomyces endolithicus]|nr:hypothetical protein LTR01_004666 [Friedmanniomyces endolithicus]KAK0829801.1 hypothetical protein LTR73_003937 [Friedmanniomyces endolithicus]